MRKGDKFKVDPAVLAERDALIEELFMAGHSLPDIARTVGLKEPSHIRAILVERDVLFDLEESEADRRRKIWERARQAARELLQSA